MSSRWLLLLLLWVFSASASADAAVGTAAVDTWYVRPAAECVNNGDGLASTCAASAGASGAFNSFSNVIWTATTGVDDGDTLCVSGKHRETLIPANSGTVALPITISLKCNGVTAGTITGANIESSWTGPDGNGNYTAGTAYTTPLWVLVDGVVARHGTSTGALTSGQWFLTGTTVVYRGDPSEKVIEIAVRGVNIDGSASNSSNIIIYGGGASSTGFGAASGGGRLEATRLIASKAAITFKDCSNISVTGLTFYAHHGGIDYRGTCHDSTGTYNTLTYTGDGLDSNFEAAAPYNITYSYNDVSSTYLGGTNDFLASTVASHSTTIDKECIASTFAGNNIRAYRNLAHDCWTGISFLPNAVVTGYIIESNRVYDIASSGLLLANAGNLAVTQSAIAGNLVENTGLSNECNSYGVVHTGATDAPGSQVEIVNNMIINAGATLNVNGTAARNSTGSVLNNVGIQPRCASAPYQVNMTNWSNRVSANINNNVWYSTATQWWRVGSVRTTFSTFQSDVTPQETASVMTNPLLTSIAAPYNLKSTAASPVRRAGTPTGACKDVRGRACYPDSPDIGAYQATSGDPAGPRAPVQ